MFPPGFTMKSAGFAICLPNRDKGIEKIRNVTAKVIV